MNEKRGPKTVALFMDGNRRWAASRGLSVIEGHQAGGKVFLSFIDFCADVREKWGTENYIFYAFSTENWNRSSEEVAGIMSVFEHAFDEFARLLPQVKENGIRVRFFGERDRFSSKLRERMEQLEVETASGKNNVIALAVSYGGRADILQAVNRAVREGEREITAEDVERNLWTAGIPELDLIIRAGGEKRLSNFLTWQSVYSELAFTDTLWPDFTREELEKIFEDYASRERRRGR